MKRNYSTAITTDFIILLTLLVLIGATLTGTNVLEVNKNFNKQPIYRGNTAKPQVSLMINVYWGTEYVLPMAEIFKEYNYNATFFLGGSWTAKNVDIVKELSKNGFELANHGYTHKNHKNLSVEENLKEILITERMIAEITGKESVKLFAPPSGYIGDNMIKVCNNQNIDIIMWTRDTIDWRDKDSNLVYQRAIKNMKNGDLILMHPTAHTLDALPKILDYCKANGFEVVTVSQNIEKQI